MNVLKEGALIEKDGLLTVPNYQVVESVFEINEFNWMKDVQEKSWWMYHRVGVITTLIKEFSRQGTFVEVGAGTGSISASVAKNTSLNVIAFEPGPSGASYCAERGLKVVCGYYGADTVNRGSVDNIGCFDVCEHIEDDKDFLTKIHNGLCDGGKLFLTVPAYSWLYSYSDYEGGHHRRYNLKPLLKMLDDIGFQINYEGYFLSFLPPVMYLFRKILSKKKIEVNGIIKKESDLTAQTKQFYLPVPVNNAVRTFFSFEIGMIKRHKRVPFGASIVIVAEKFRKE